MRARDGIQCGLGAGHGQPSSRLGRPFVGPGSIAAGRVESSSARATAARSSSGGRRGRLLRRIWCPTCGPCGHRLSVSVRRGRWHGRDLGCRPLAHGPGRCPMDVDRDHRDDDHHTRQLTKGTTPGVADAGTCRAGSLNRGTGSRRNRRRRALWHSRSGFYYLISSPRFLGENVRGLVAPKPGASWANRGARRGAGRRAAQNVSAPSVSTRNLIFGLGLIIGSTTARFRTMATISRVSMPVVPGFCSRMACLVKRYPPGCRRTSFLRQTTTISKGTSIDPGRGVGFGAGENRKSSEDESFGAQHCHSGRRKDSRTANSGLPDDADSGCRVATDRVGRR